MHQNLIEMQSVENICRCCCQIIQNSKKSVGLTNEILLKIFDLTKFEIDKNSENCSEFICLKCDTRLKNIQKFKQEIIKAQQKLKLWLQTTPCDHDPSKTENKTLTFVQDVEKRNTKKVEKKAIAKTEDMLFAHDQKDRRLIKHPKRLAKTYQDHFCPICNKFFTEIRKKKLHIDRVHKKQKNFSCDLCNYTAFKKYEILLHFMNIHILKKHLKKTSMCSFCGISFSSTAHLSRHVKRKHLQDKKHFCDICGKSYEALNEIKRHIATHLPAHLKKFHSCGICSRKFISKGSLKVHKDTKHSDIPPIECFCGKKFRQKSAYNRHQQVVHIGLKPYKCVHCQKEFSGKNHLDYHLKAWHTPVVLIPCEFCGQKYKTEESLKRHQIYHNDPQHQCKVCDAKFHENRKLMDHMSAHIKLPFPCPSCSRTFRLESQVRTHCKKCHNTEKLTFKCEMCRSSFTRKSTYRDHALRQHKELNQEDLNQFLFRIRKSIAEEHKTQTFK